MLAVFHSSPFLIASLSYLVACSAVAQEQTPESDEGLLELNSSDFLRGSVQKLDADGKLTWKHTLTNQEIRFNSEGIRRILFNRETKPREASDVVWLISGDRFVCRVQSITDTEVLVASSVLGLTLRFKRSEVASVTLRDSTVSDDTILGGSMDAADWDVPGGRTDSSNVTFDNGKMIIGGSYWPTISRKAKFPEAFIIDTEIDWKDSLAMRFEIGASDDNHDVAKVSFTMEVQAESIRMQRVSISEAAKRKSYSTLANVRDIDKFTDGARSIHLQCYINTISGDCSVFINGKFAGKSDGPLINPALNGTHVLGTGIHVLQKSASPTRIRSFAVKQWDGRSLPSQTRIRKMDSDHIYFEDGDNTKGNIIALKVSGDERILTAEIPYSEKSVVSIPAPFLDYFTFGNKNESNTDDAKSTIFAHLTDGSILHLSRLKSGENSTLEGNLMGGYPIKIPSEALAELRFDTDKTEETDGE